MPKLLTVLTDPNPCLRKKSEEIILDKIKSSAFKIFCSNLTHTMLKKDGVGIAAPQVGKNIRLIVISSKNGTEIFINPKIIKRSFAKQNLEEGCLSVPGWFGMVKRNKKIKCSYYNLRGEKKFIIADGLMSTVLQHEIDHLDGILFIDKAKDAKQIDLDKI